MDQLTHPAPENNSFLLQNAQPHLASISLPPLLHPPRLKELCLERIALRVGEGLHDEPRGRGGHQLRMDEAIVMRSHLCSADRKLLAGAGGGRTAAEELETAWEKPQVW